MGETSQADKRPESYFILYQGGSGELTEKKSRFIANTRPVTSEEEALAFVEEMRKKYWDARHNCWAYVIGERGEKKRCSDDSRKADAGRIIRSGSNQSVRGGNQVLRRSAAGDGRPCKSVFRRGKGRPGSKCGSREKAGRKNRHAARPDFLDGENAVQHRRGPKTQGAQTDSTPA